MKRQSIIRYAEPKIKAALNELGNSTTEDRKLYEFINRALDDLEENAFCGIQIPKRLIPREYVQKYNINNLWKYNLPNAWRLIYSITDAGEVKLISIIIEWLDHKSYEREFNY